MGNSTEASQLCSKGLRFGGTLKVVEKYWEAGPCSICMSCAEIRHDQLTGCGNKGVQCVIYAGAHKVKSHKCGVIGCTAKIEKICTHVIPKCANCGENHHATAFKCPAKLKAQTEAWKKKMEKPRLDKKLPVTNNSANERPASRQIDMEIDIEITNLAKSPRALSSC